jgi:predicted phosphohydrolase
MIIQYCSDLHLEFKENAEFLARNPIQPEGNILMLAGDVVPFAVMDKHGDFFDQISAQFETVYWIPGNHEYYHSDLQRRSGPLYEKIRKNVLLVNNQVVEHEYVRFILTTLWSEIGPARQWEAQQSLADFQVIKYGDSRFLPIHFNHLHKESKGFIEAALTQKWSGKTVVMTHHVPTLSNYPPEFKGSSLNDAFAVEMADIIEPSGVDYWIYGHHHHFVPEFCMGTTRLVTNQLGYVRYQEHVNFDESSTFTL